MHDTIALIVIVILTIAVVSYEIYEFRKELKLINQASAERKKIIKVIFKTGNYHWQEDARRFSQVSWESHKKAILKGEDAISLYGVRLQELYHEKG